MHLVGFTTASYSGLAAAACPPAVGVVSGGSGVRPRDGLGPLMSAGSLFFSLQFSFLLR